MFQLSIIVSQNDMISYTQIQTNYTFLIGSSIICAFLLILLVYYCMRIRQTGAPILAIFALLLLNELFESLFEMFSYMQEISNLTCQISLIGKTAFTTSASYWIIFITKLIYRERAAPGKYMDIAAFVSKNLVFTYLPSVTISLFLLIMINVVNTESQFNCWRVIQNKQAADYIIYLTAFIMPSFIALVIVWIYLLAYFRLKSGGHSFFLIYPLVSSFFNLYYISIKLYLFLNQEEITDNLEIPFIVEPLTYGIVFLFLKSKLDGKDRPRSSDLTIKGQQHTDSFLDI